MNTIKRPNTLWLRLILLSLLLASITAKTQVLINEIEVNPPSKDYPFEYLELKGNPSGSLTNLYLVVIDGAATNSGSALLVFNLGYTNRTLGTNGLLVIKATSGGHTIPAGTTVVGDSRFNTNATLGNDSISVLLVESLNAPAEGTDYDPATNGFFTVSPLSAARIVDAIGWKKNTNDLVYGGVSLDDNSSPDAVTRLPTDPTPLSKSAWYRGNFPTGAQSDTNYSATSIKPSSITNILAVPYLTPGSANVPLPPVSFIAAQSGVVGDPTTPAIAFTLTNGNATVTATSSDTNVVLNTATNLVLGGSGVNRTLKINPINIGYNITISLSTTNYTNSFSYSASGGYTNTAFFHTGAGDASAAVAIDTNLMLVGDDEYLSIGLYSRTNSGLPIARYEYTSWLSLTNYGEDGVRLESDLEAATKTGNRVYWLTSLGNAADGHIVPNRNRLFATTLSGSGASTTLVYVGRYDRLREDIVEWDNQSLHGKGQGYYGLEASSAKGKVPKALDGFNVEAITIAPGNTNLAYIGFRAPLVPRADRRKALLLPVTNLSQLVTGSPATGPAQFGDPIELDLGGRGIRSIEANSNGFLIVAGPSESNTGDPHEFKLFTWSGNPLESPQMRGAMLTGLTPESIVELPDTLTATSRVQVVSDNGTMVWYPPNTTACKDLPETNFKKFRSDWVTLGDVVSPYLNAFTNTAATAARFSRGTGTNTAYHSFVAPLSQQRGIALDLSEGNGRALFPSNPWTNTLNHYNATNPGTPISFKNPIAAFGSAAGATALYVNQSYGFKVGFGDRPKVAAETNQAFLTITVYDRVSFARMDDLQIFLPLNPAPPDFSSEGLTLEDAKYGLTTTIQLAAESNGGTPTYYLTHNAGKTEYVFLVSGLGYLGSVVGTNARTTMVTNGTVAASSPLYVMNFEQLPAWRSAFIGQPHFDGEPLPSFYAGKSLQELLTNSCVVTNAVSLPNNPSTYTNLDASLELRRHPLLDSFVADMGRNPLALANYVFNEIELTDAMSYNASGSLTNQSVNLGGVNRGALGAFLEGQGSPVEQCALLVYFLRQSGVPAVYMYPTNNSVKLLNTRLSKLLRVQLKGAVADNGASNVPQMIPVNYPWVAAYIGTNWVHLFPWLKDTEIIEGLNLYDYMPTKYNSGKKWAMDYLYCNNDIMYWERQNDTAARLFLRFLAHNFSENHAGIALDDIGVRITNRRSQRARWQDFPTPTWVENASVAVESLASLTNAFPALTNVFDTVSIEVESVANPTRKITTGDLPLLSLHDRQFLLWFRETNSNYEMTLALDSYRPSQTNTVYFGGFNPLNPADTNLLSRVIGTNLLTSSDDKLTVRMTHKKYTPQLSGYVTNPPAHYSTFLGYREVQPFNQVQVITHESTVRKGDLTSICFNSGQVSPKMLAQHDQKYWLIQRLIQQTPSATNTVAVEDYEGRFATLMGMAYFESVNRSRLVLQQFHKAQTVTWNAVALSKWGAKRDANGVLLPGKLAYNRAMLDVCHQQIAYAGNGTIHADAELDAVLANDDFYELFMLEASSQEHFIINRFLGKSTAVSTVSLLQAAQRGGIASDYGILNLNCTNYVSFGTNVFNGMALKDWDTNIWKTITNTFTASFSNNVRVFMTPGGISSTAGTNVAAMIYAGEYFAALLSPNLNGGMSDEEELWYLMDHANDIVVLYYSKPDDAYHVEAWFGDNLYTGDRVAEMNPERNGEKLPAFIVTTGLGALSFIQGMDQLYELGVLPLSTLPPAKVYFALPGATDSEVRFLIADLGYTGPSIFKNAQIVVFDPVNVITGDFYVNATDITIQGPWPLQLSRNYSSHATTDGEFGWNWKLSYFPYLVVVPDESLVYAAEMNGSVIAYRKQTNNLWVPKPEDNASLVNPNQRIQASENMFNARLERVVDQSGTNYFLYSPDGSIRTFTVRAFPTAQLTRQRPYLSKWQDHRGNYYLFYFGTDPNATDYGQMRRIESNNGNFLVLAYDTAGHITEAASSDGRHAKYAYDPIDGDLVKVTLPDQSEIQYQYHLVPDATQTITNYYYGWLSYTNGTNASDYRWSALSNSVTAKLVSSHLIVKEIKPDGRGIKNVFDSQNRVIEQWAPAGQDLNLYRTASFVYSNNFALTNVAGGVTGATWVYDAYGNATRYEYTNSLLAKVTDPLANTTEQVWFTSTNDTGYYVRSLKSAKDKRGLWTDYRYDTNGNAASIIVRGDLTGDGISTQTATNSATYTNNLPLEVTSPAGNQVRYAYHSTFKYLPEQIIITAGGVVQSTNYYVYHSVTNVMTIGGFSITNFACGLPQKVIRAYGSSDAATNEWDHDGRGYVTRETRYSGTADPPVTNWFFFNDAGLRVEQSNSLAVQRFDYDNAGRMRWQETWTPGASQPLAWEQLYYNDNGEVIWRDGPRYDPEDYQWQDYDGMGRPIVDIRWRSRAKEDGSGVESETGDNLYATSFAEYDLFGNLTKAVNPRGAIAVMKYDRIGQLLSRSAYESNGQLLATDTFGYDPGGLLAFHTNALGGVAEKQYAATGKPKYQKNPDGSTNAWRYYLDGRVKQEYLSNGNYWETVYDDANRKVTRSFKSGGNTLATTVSELDRRGNLIKRTDEAGNVFTSSYDGLDRLKLAAGPAVTNVNASWDFVYTTNVASHLAAYLYDSSGKMLTMTNALGEKSITTTDALGRPVSVEIRDAQNNLVRTATTAYSVDHHSVTVTNGSGSSAIVTTTYTDTFGNRLLAVGYPAANVKEFTLSRYDAAGNRTYQGQYSSTNSTVSIWSTNVWTFDGLNRIKTETVRDGATTTFAYDALGDVTNKAMPGSLSWVATFDSAGRIQTEKDTAGGQDTRSLTYAYYSSGQWQGRLFTITDGRAVARTNTYDDFLRLASVGATGPLDEQKSTTTWQYDVRSLPTNITQSFTSTNTGPTTTIIRNYTPYGEIASETVTVGGVSQPFANQSWDSVGRRTRLYFSGFEMDFQYRADGLMTGVNGAIFSFGDNGLLDSRNNAYRSLAVNSRDGRGRPLQITTSVQSTPQLTEYLTWRGDGLLTAYTANQNFTNSCQYEYGSGNQRLTKEKFYVGASQPVTNTYTFDQGQAGGLGVLTSADQAGTLASAWSVASTNLDNFKRVKGEQNSAIHRAAKGAVNGPATLRANVSGRPVDLHYNPTSSTGSLWTAEMALFPGTNVLTVYADHPSGQFTTNKVSTFTVTNGALDKIDTQFDAAGNITNRVWKKANGTLVKSQALVWDALGRLVKVIERDASTNGYNWQATFDGLGRRIRTTVDTVTNAVALAPRFLTLNSYYDPQVEFLEVGVSVNGVTTWKVYGPDTDGAYGSQQGLGGLEALVGLTSSGVIQDYYGNILASAVNSTVIWNATRLNSYGPAEGYTPPSPTLSLTPEHLSWRGKWRDVTGLYYWGARPYDVERRSFLSFDPYGHFAAPDGYASFNNNPTINWDPDARCDKPNQIGPYVLPYLLSPNFAVRFENPSAASTVFQQGYPRSGTLDPADVAFNESTASQEASLFESTLGRSGRSWYPASANSGGAYTIDGPFNGKPLYIDLNQAGEIATHDQIIASARLTGIPEWRIKIYQLDYRHTGELLVNNVPGGAVLPKSAFVANSFGQAGTAIGIALTAGRMYYAGERSYRTQDPSPLVNQTIREAGGWGGALVGAKGTALIILAGGWETGPAYPFLIIGGSIVGGYLGYQGADMLVENKSSGKTYLPDMRYFFP